MPLAVQPVTSTSAALAADLGVALQPGTIVDARVLQILDANLVRIAIASLTLDVPTAKPLQQGQVLQLAVAQTADGLSLTPVADDIAGSSPVRAPAVIVDDVPLAPRAPAQGAAALSLTPVETQAVEVAARSAVTKQAGLSPLFANLSVAVQAGKLPQPVLAAATPLLGLRIPTTARMTGDDVKAALQSSGLVMEAALAKPIHAVAPDIKSALLVLRQALATWLSPEADVAPVPQGGNPPSPTASPLIPPQSSPPPRPSPGQPAVSASNAASEPRPEIASGTAGATMPIPAATRAAILSTANAAVQEMSVAADVEPPAATPKNLLAAQIIASALREPVAAAPAAASREMTTQATPPPVRGAPPTAQPIASPSIALDAEPAIVARHLIADTDGAIARQTLLQIASLPDRADALSLRSEPAQPRWNFEIPFVTPQGTAMAQFEIARDGSGPQSELAQRVWRARFSIDIEPAGPVHALIAFGGDTTSVKMWAERPATVARLRANAFELTRSLGRAELKAGDIVVADGAPARGKVASGHFLNRAT